MICVGLTGPNASGKGEVARYLSQRGFSIHSLSDAVREESTARGLDHTRENLIRVGTLLRSEFGEGILAERTLAKLSQRSVVDSIRNAGEVRVLRTLPGFLLLGVDAPEGIRFERSRRRARAGDGATLEEFRNKEAKEKSVRGPGQQLEVCLAMADLHITNDSSLEELHRRVQSALSSRGITL